MHTLSSTCMCMNDDMYACETHWQQKVFGMCISCKWSHQTPETNMLHRQPRMNDLRSAMRHARSTIWTGGSTRVIALSLSVASRSACLHSTLVEMCAENRRKSSSDCEDLTLAVLNARISSFAWVQCVTNVFWSCGVSRAEPSLMVAGLTEVRKFERYCALLAI